MTSAVRTWVAISAIMAATVIGVTALFTSQLPTGAATVALVSDSTHLPYDVEGRPVDAHDGQIIEFEHVYYLIGTSYSCGFQYAAQPVTQYCGVFIYSSTDLVHWSFDEQALSIGEFQPCSCFRPRVAQNADGQWVMWLNANHEYDVFTSTGATPGSAQYALTTTIAAPAGYVYGDEDLYVDPTSGTGYLAYAYSGAGLNHQLRISALDPTLTSFTAAAPARMPFMLDEAPALFEAGGSYYLLFSDPTCAYCDATGTGLATAHSPLGPWVFRSIPWPTSCGGQPTAVDTLDGRFLYQSDRWQVGPGAILVRNQVAAPTYLAPFVITNGTIAPQTCITAFPWIGRPAG